MNSVHHPEKGNLNVNMYESILRLQGAQQAHDTSDCKYLIYFNLKDNELSRIG